MATLVPIAMVLVLPELAPAEIPLLREAAAETVALDLARNARALADEGRLDEALEATEHALTAVQQEYGPDHPYAAFIFDDLAMLQLRLGRSQKALEASDQAVQRIRRHREDFPVDHALLLNNAAAVRADLGRFHEAEPLNLEAYAALFDQLGPADERTILAAQNLGRTYLELSRPDKARVYVQRALDARRTAFGEADVAAADLYLDLAAIELDVGNEDAAGAAADQARALLERDTSADKVRMIEAEKTLAQIAIARSQLNEAGEFLRRALRRLDAGDSAGERSTAASVFYNLGFLHFIRGRFVEAEPDYRRALDLYEESVSAKHPAVGRTLHALALVYHGLGQYDLATQLYERAISIFAESLGPSSASVAATRVEFAALLAERGEAERAERESRAALAALKRDPEERMLQRGYGFSSLGLALREQGRLEEAAEAYQQALTLIESERGAQSSDLPPGLTELALLRLKQKRLGDAEELVRRAIAIRERDAAITPWGLARSLTVLGRILEAQERSFEALEVSRRAAAVMRSRLDVAEVTRSAGVRGEILKEREVFERHLEIAYPLLEDGRDDLLAELFEVAQFPQLTGTAAAISRMAARFAAGEDSLGRLLRQRQDAIEAWTSRDHRLRDLLASETDAAAVEALRAELKELDGRIRALDAELQSRFPDFAQLTQPRPVSQKETQDLLAADEALLIQVTTEAETYLFFVRRDAALVARTPLTRERLTADVTSLRSGLELRTTLRALAPFDVEAAHRLYQALFAPFEAEISEVGNLLFVPDGAMQNLTPSVLLVRPAPEPTAYPAEAADQFRQLAFFGLQTALSVVPSVSALKSLRMIATAARAPRPFVGFGDPIFGGPSGERRGVFPDQVFVGATAIDLRSLRERLMPLADTRDELRALAASFGAPDDDIFLGTRATEAVLRSLDLTAFRTVAFATHALVAGEFQGIAEPALILTIPEAGQAPAEVDGVLLASEVASLELNADWVLLSACNTAAPAGRPGAEGLSGLAQAFFYAGARALLVSHWYVVSRAAVELTTTAARELNGDPGISRAEALRRAMLRVARSPESAHPVFWAPFVVVGAEGRK